MGRRVNRPMSPAILGGFLSSDKRTLLGSPSTKHGPMAYSENENKLPSRHNFPPRAGCYHHWFVRRGRDPIRWSARFVYGGCEPGYRPDHSGDDQVGAPALHHALPGNKKFGFWGPIFRCAA